MMRPFVQNGHDRTGLGLGLSICSKAVKSMNGELEIHDLPGKGCVFSVELPRVIDGLARAGHKIATEEGSMG